MENSNTDIADNSLPGASRKAIKATLVFFGPRQQSETNLASSLRRPEGYFTAYIPGLTLSSHHLSDHFTDATVCSSTRGNFEVLCEEQS